MAFHGKFHFREIERATDGVDVTFTEADSWALEALERAAPKPELTGLEPAAWAKKSKFSGSLRIEPAGIQVVIRGAFEAQVPAPCSRCSDLFDVRRQADLNIVLHALRRGEDPQDDGGDADYIVVDADEFDLRDILSEQLIVLEPVAECPARAADGSCTLCKKNPQFENVAGQAHESKADSPFSKLEALKSKLGSKT